MTEPFIFDGDISFGPRDRERSYKIYEDEIWHRVELYDDGGGFFVGFISRDESGFTGMVGLTSVGPHPSTVECVKAMIEQNNTGT